MQYVARMNTVHQMQELMHKRCSRIKGSLSKASKSFLWRPRLAPSSDSDVRTCMNIGGGFSVELVDEFCYWDIIPG